ncbi:hypothetical protein ACFQH2_02150 [Natronoarchaeum sp. GCM10025703]|uniref:hypothetical protein n=1 Tax=unclassified Natronoarchaeum TaxID=2620183 RepID=UPI003621E1F1
MRAEDDGQYDAAIAALSDREYPLAGDAYTRAGRRVLSGPREDVGPFDDDERGWVGIGLGYLCTAAICYRVAGRDVRATRRAVEGIAVARDLAHVTERPVQAACFEEFVADLHVAGDLSGTEDAYEDASTAYEDASDGIDDPQRWGTTPLFEAAATPIKQVARSLADGEIAIKWEQLHGSDPAAPGNFLAHRARYKRRRFPSLLERVVETGYLAAPRGSTEYDTDHHYCPNCDSTSVNWVGEDVLCMRCSSVARPQ